MSAVSAVVVHHRPSTEGHLPGLLGHRLLSGAQTNGAHSAWVARLLPGSEAPLHVHSREDETFFILSGELNARVGDEEHTLSAGDCVFLPRGIPHRLANLSLDPAEVIMLIHPPQLEGYFTEMTEMMSRGGIDPLRMEEAAARYGITMLEKSDHLAREI